MSSISTPREGAPANEVSLDPKLSQLCSQVKEALELALACASNAKLRDLTVDSVTSLRGAALLNVQLTAWDSDYSYEDLCGAIESASGYLRSEAAAAVHRKRAPNLQFEYVPRFVMPEADES